MKKPGEGFRALRESEPRGLLHCLRLPENRTSGDDLKCPASVKRLGQCAIGFSLLLGSCGMQDMNLRDSVCDYSIEEFFELRSGLESRTDLSKKEIEAISRKLGYEEEPVDDDFQQLIGGLKAPGENKTLHVYKKSCEYDNNVQVIYRTSFISISGGGILEAKESDNNRRALEFRIIMNLESFMNSGQKFRYEFFEIPEDGKKAIWELTGTGTSIEELEDILMINELHNYVSRYDHGIINKAIEIQYRYFPSRRFIVMDETWIMVFRFNSDNKILGMRDNYGLSLQ